MTITRSQTYNEYANYVRNYINSGAEYGLSTYDEWLLNMEYEKIDEDMGPKAEPKPETVMVKRTAGMMGWPKAPGKVMTFPSWAEAACFARHLANYTGTEVRLGYDISGKCNDQGHYFGRDWNHDGSEMPDPRMPNGMESWGEALFKLAEGMLYEISLHEDLDPNPDDNYLMRVHNDEGTGGVMALAIKWATEFEQRYNGTPWGEDLDWSDEIDGFLMEKALPLDQKYIKIAHEMFEVLANGRFADVDEFAVPFSAVAKTALLLTMADKAGSIPYNDDGNVFYGDEKFNVIDECGQHLIHEFEEHMDGDTAAQYFADKDQ